MGIPKPEDWGNSRWITWERTSINSGPLPMFRREFEVSRQVRRATAYISGLRFFELYLNGHRVGDHVLEPGWTNYRRTTLYATSEGFELTVKIPPNATATVFLPGRSQQGVTENGRPVSGAEGVRFLRQEGSALVFEVASGQYDFRVPKP
jgi:hypothetical protein